MFRQHVNTHIKSKLKAPCACTLKQFFDKHVGLLADAEDAGDSIHILDVCRGCVVNAHVFCVQAIKHLEEKQVIQDVGDKVHENSGQNNTHKVNVAQRIHEF